MCSGGTVAVAPCPPGQTCPAVMPPPPTCAESKRMCTPRYLLPCEQASDCGAGFACKPNQVCTCSASAGSATPPVPMTMTPAPTPAPAPAADAGTAPSKGDPDAPVSSPAQDAGMAVSSPTTSCECHDSEDKHCDLLEMLCNVDADCPATFHCVPSPTKSAPACTRVPGSDAPSCAAPADTTPEPNRCLPIYTSAGGEAGFARDEAASAGSPTPPTAAPVAQSGSAGGPATTNGNAVAGPVTAGADQPAGPEAPPSVDAGHCSVFAVGTSATTPVWMLASVAAALALGLRRRRC